jgi:hypothetical protein
MLGTATVNAGVSVVQLLSNVFFNRTSATLERSDIDETTVEGVWVLTVRR